MFLTPETPIMENGDGGSTYMETSSWARAWLVTREPVLWYSTILSTDVYSPGNAMEFNNYNSGEGAGANMRLARHSGRVEADASTHHWTPVVTTEKWNAIGSGVPEDHAHHNRMQENLYQLLDIAKVQIAKKFWPGAVYVEDIMSRFEFVDEDGNMLA